MPEWNDVFKFKREINEQEREYLQKGEFTIDEFDMDVYHMEGDRLYFHIEGECMWTVDFDWQSNVHTVTVNMEHTHGGSIQEIRYREFRAINQMLDNWFFEWNYEMWKRKNQVLTFQHWVKSEE